jgi:hypothetical protein
MDVEPMIILTIQNDSTMSRTLKRGQPLNINLQTYQEPKPEIIGDVPIAYEKEWAEMADRVVAQSDNLDEEGNGTLRALLEEFIDVFRLKTDRQGRIEQYAVPIHLTTPVPICLAQYQLSAPDIEEVNRQVASMLRAGVIEPSTSPYNFPVLLADKKIIANEEVEIRDRRFCIDLRALNAITEKINFSMPTCDHTIHHLKGSKFYSCLDILSGFWHLPLTNEMCQYVAFSTQKGHFEFKVLPFGWVNSPFWFQRFTQTCITNPSCECCQTYINDVVKFSKEVDDHFQHIRQVLTRCRELGVWLKMSKCSFFAHEMEYLGHIISADGIRMNPNKVKAILKVKTPQTKKQVHSFLGKINYYAKFLPCLSEIAQPIARLTDKTVPFVWNEETEEAFQRLKERIAADVMLAFPDQDRPFTVTTDASEYAIEAVLSDTDPASGIERPVMFLSKALDCTQSNWCTPEKELYAVVYALEKFCPYIYARPFTLVTDHRALLWCCGKRNVHGRLARWSVTISQYAQDIKYIQGHNNHVADALS